MNRRTMILMGTLSLIPFASDYSFGEDEHKKQQALIKAIASAKITLQQGLAAAGSRGPADFR
jgi:hypothetical protein